jgi:succinate-semialdehyde dehydrogenase/glutarate-semialdehyde dehydrogenase
MDLAHEMGYARNAPTTATPARRILFFFGDNRQMILQSVNPATNRVENTFPCWSLQTTATVLDDMSEAWSRWAVFPMRERVDMLCEAAREIRARLEPLAVLITHEMGKPLREARLEVEKCAMICEHYAAHGPQYLAPMRPHGAPQDATVVFEPQGVVLAVMPWNFPFWQVFRIAAPTLLAGNGVALKHAPNVPGCAEVIEHIFLSAGLPENVFRSLFIDEDVVEPVLSHPGVAGVSLTGSCGAGSSVAAAAGRYLKKSVLELGGSDPFIVLPDAELDKAVPTAVASRCRNAGQACIAAKRFILHRDIYDEFLERLIFAMEDVRVGDPLRPDTDMGPLASVYQRDRLQNQVDRCVEAGGCILLGGSPLPGAGAFYPPTVIADVPPDADVAGEELFGPVALVFRAEDEDEAVALANGTDFGLGGAVWTADTKRGLALAARIRAGSVCVNGLVRSDPFLPFGGTRSSGYGREMAEYGLREFVNIKCVRTG